MTPFVQLLLYTFVVGVVGTGMGGVLGALFKKDSNRTVSLLLSFAGGIMLSIACFDLILGSIGQNKENLWVTVIFIIIGIGVIYLLNLFVDNATSKKIAHLKSKDHPKTHDDIDELTHSNQLIEEYKENESNNSLFKAGLVMLLAIGLHNFPEGMAIGSSFEMNKSVGVTLAILLALHNIPEGMSIVVPLFSGGMKKYKSILLTAFSGFPTVLGAILGYLVGGINDSISAMCISFAAGAMIYVVVAEILPQSILMYKSKLPAFFTMLGMICGLILSNII